MVFWRAEIDKDTVVPRRGDNSLCLDALNLERAHHGERTRIRTSADLDGSR